MQCFYPFSFSLNYRNKIHPGATSRLCQLKIFSVRSHFSSSPLQHSNTPGLLFFMLISVWERRRDLWIHFHLGHPPPGNPLSLLFPSPLGLCILVKPTSWGLPDTYTPPLPSSEIWHDWVEGLKGTLGRVWGSKLPVWEPKSGQLNSLGLQRTGDGARVVPCVWYI